MQANKAMVLVSLIKNQQVQVVFVPPPPGTLGPTPWDKLSHPLGQIVPPPGTIFKPVLKVIRNVVSV